VRATQKVTVFTGTGFDGCGTINGGQQLVVTEKKRTTPAVTSIWLYSTVAGRATALPRPEGVAAALRKTATACEARSWVHGVLTEHVTGRSVVVANTAVMVRTQATVTPKDRAFLEKLVAALEAARSD
jgi:hypothetical protein